MGLVYAAQDLRADRHVALKILRPDIAAVVGSERFTQEIRILSRLQHPNILQLLDVGQADGLPYYVTPFIEGDTLAQLVQREEQLPIDEAVRITAETADALSYAHEQGVVHRDIKPENILLAAGHPVVADFGVARALDRLGGERLTETGIAIGTPTYMSPEQASATGKIDGRSDIYSLACVLYEMLVGQPPFSGPTASAILARHLVDPVPKPRTVRRTIPEALEHTIETALAKMPADRYSTAQDFRTALVRSIVPGATAPTRRGRVSWRWGTVTGAAVAGTVLVWLFIAGLSRPLDPDRITVFPLVSSATGPEHATLGEDLATMIGHALEGTDALRTIDGWTQLGQDERDDIRSLSLRRYDEIASARESAFALMGRVVTRGDSMEVLLDLRDVRGDSIVARASAGGPVDQAWRVGLRAVNGLLPTLIPTGAPPVLADWEDRHPRAVASFLLAEREFRRSHFDAALTRYREAIAIDSLFGLAAIRGAQAATWSHQWEDADLLVRRALRQEESLPLRQREFAKGLDAQLRGQPDTAVAHLEAALALDPGMSVAWMQLGEVFTHHLPRAAQLDSLAEVAFTRAYAVDSSAAYVLFHLIESAIRKGQLERAAVLRERWLTAGPEDRLRRQVDLIYACARRGEGAVNWRQVGSEFPLAVLAAAKTLSAGGYQSSCAEAGYRAVLAYDTAVGAPGDGRRWSAVVGIESLLLGQGRAAEGVAILDSVITSGFGGTSLYLQAAAAGADVRRQAEDVARADREAFGETYEGVEFPTRLWQLGLWEAARGDSARVSAIARHLDAWAARTGTRFDSLLARSMRAHAAAARGDTMAAVAQLLDVWPNAPAAGSLAWSVAESLGPDRLLLARLLLAEGRFRQALEVATAFDAPASVIYPLYLAASLEVRARAAEALGDERLARQYRRRLHAFTGRAAPSG
jgi:serine/threonine-protein kinase